MEEEQLNSNSNDDEAPFRRYFKYLLWGAGLFAAFCLYAISTGLYYDFTEKPEENKRPPREVIQFNPQKTVEHARDEAGFLENIFCRGGQRSSFCD